MAPRSTFQDLYEGLQALSDQSFPRKCPNCKKVFHSVDDFLFRETEEVMDSSGLKEAQEEDQYLVEVFRNCTCGSTLVEEFKDRRNTSPKGRERRRLFGKLLGKLEAAGLSTESARAELLGVMRGQPSEVLRQLGFKIRVRRPGTGD